ncbi:hypothetical protein HPC49_12800 [Pyxidicoccus fallax]|uniref:DUF6734 domain-containing protein n=1 Tax=Pyxidicoccus fallax TaxID=394095 RepID=A0A848L9B5_9BACT|nr:DUF6734 family protein [Pyxidicoccus fallax]NMO15419.1 hypothetical protein [Pyxidicoccus fallax]NPC79114.1 hypothetical protein [Pyxidicoccus fallax]
MRAVWSFWSKPYWGGRGIPWLYDRAHWLSWILSVQTARRHYPEVALVTDSPGRRVLVEQLGLEFSEVSTELDALEAADSRWWALGKLHAYRAQQKPFVHVDADVFLWKRLPDIVEYAPVFAQSPEPVSGNSVYQAERIRRVLESHGGQVPGEWLWYQSQLSQMAACCGILGGNDVAFLQDYANLAIDVVSHPRNQRGWARVEDLSNHNVLVEQYLLCACAEYQRAWAHAPHRDVYIQYLFPTGAPDNAEEVGYTHLVAGAKKHRQTIERLEEVVRRDYPELYQRCLAYEQSRSEGTAGPS